MTFLETERLRFRSHEPADESDFVRMHMDPEVRRYTGGKGWLLEKAQHRFTTEYLGRPTKTYGMWATILKEEEKYIGSCGLRPGQNGSEAHLGCYIARPYWRRGLATEAVRAFLGVAFSRFDLSRLLADIEMGNAASEHIVQKFGFSYIGREEIPASGRVINTYRLAKADWERKTSQSVAESA